MAIDEGNGVWIGDGDMVRLYAHEGSKRLVSLVHGEISPSPPALIQQPEVADEGKLGTRNVSDGISTDVW